MLCKSLLETDQVAGLRLGENALERDGGQVVALVHDDLSVVGGDALNLLLANEAVDHRDIKPAVPGLLARFDLSSFLRLDAEEQR